MIGGKKVKKYKLRTWVKVVLVSITIIMIGFILTKLDDDFMTNCMNSGYSKDYCIEHK